MDVHMFAGAYLYEAEKRRVGLFIIANVQEQKKVEAR